MNNQVGGSHYSQFKYQPTDFIEDVGLGFILGNTVECIARFKSKGGAEDLKKAVSYLVKFKDRGMVIDFRGNEESVRDCMLRFLYQFAGFQYNALSEIFFCEIDSAILLIGERITAEEGGNCDLKPAAYTSDVRGS